MGSACSCSQSADDSKSNPDVSTAKEVFCNGQNGRICGTENGIINHALLEEVKDLTAESKDATNKNPREEMSTEISSLVSRLEVAVDRLERLGGDTAGKASHAVHSSPTKEDSSVPFLIAYDELLRGPLKVFLDCSKQIGGDVAEISKLVESLFATQRSFLAIAAASQKPSDTELAKVLEPTGKKIQEVINYRESHRTSPLFNHLSAISESISGLSWVAIAPAPGPYVKEMGDAAMFYSNRVLKDFRDKDKNHVSWVQHWSNIFKELQSYIKTHHTTGVFWNPRGSSSVQACPSGGIPPPPCGIPPPPPLMKLEPVKVVDDGRSALFSEINKGTDITASLRKVDDSMKTHKNPSLRQEPKPLVKAPTGGAVYNSSAASIEKPPRIALEGKKWFVEYQKNASNLVLDNCKMEHSIYIFRCENTVVQIKGKVNSVILDSCKKTSVVFDTLVSACEIVNCQSCQMQVMDKVPTVSIEKTDGCQVYLSLQSLKVEIISAKSSEMNIMIPKPDGDFTECPVPEQFKSIITGNKLTTSVTEKA